MPNLNNNHFHKSGAVGGRCMGVLVNIGLRGVYQDLGEKGQTMVRDTAKGNLRRCGNAALGGVGVVLLVAVPALGLTALGPDFFPGGQGAGEGPAVSNGPLTFDAPAVTLRKVRPPAAPGGRPAGEPDDAAVILDDWKFTGTLTVFDCLVMDFQQLYKTNPAAYAYLVFFVAPPLVSNSFAYFQSLPPQQQAALLLFLLAYLNSPCPTQPTPVSPSH
jgi:hypothetical protein